MFIVAGLRHQDGMSSALSFDEVVGSNIRHDLRTRIDFGMEFCLELAESLEERGLVSISFF